MIKVNGVTIAGNCSNSIIVTGNKVYVDDNEVQLPDDKNISIEIKGNVETVKSTSGNVKIEGSAVNVSTTSGDIYISKDVNGNVCTASGDVNCCKIQGSVSTISGDINRRI